MWHYCMIIYLSHTAYSTHATCGIIVWYSTCLTLYKEHMPHVALLYDNLLVSHCIQQTCHMWHYCMIFYLSHTVYSTHAAWGIIVWYSTCLTLYTAHMPHGALLYDILLVSHCIQHAVCLPSWTISTSISTSVATTTLPLSVLAVIVRWFSTSKTSQQLVFCIYIDSWPFVFIVS
jgi:hypothetical protein